jgi:hypothetical protein
VTWIAVIPPSGKAPTGALGALLLQSYAKSGTKAKVTWAGAKALVDYRSGTKLADDATSEVSLPGEYGTALLWAVSDPAAFQITKPAGAK